MKLPLNDALLNNHQKLQNYFQLGKILYKNPFPVAHKYHAMDLRGQIFKQH